MYKKILLALDLEGVNNVKGVPYEALSKGTDEVLGKDAHSVVSTVHNIQEFIICI